jgi:MFS family permease
MKHILVLFLLINYIGYFFALLCFTYALSAPFVGILTKKVKRRYITLVSFFIACISLLMFGPSQMLNFPK